MSLSSVKRYADKAKREESLAPKRRSGSVPKLDEKAMRLLEEDLTRAPVRHPAGALRVRVGFATGLSVSRSMTYRALARLGPTRKKGGA